MPHAYLIRQATLPAVQIHVRLPHQLLRRCHRLSGQAIARRQRGSASSAILGRTCPSHSYQVNTTHCPVSKVRVCPSQLYVRKHLPHQHTICHRPILQAFVWPTFIVLFLCFFYRVFAIASMCVCQITIPLQLHHTCTTNQCWRTPRQGREERRQAPDPDDRRHHPDTQLPQHGLYQS